jgi:hypothetical protein
MTQMPFRPRELVEETEAYLGETSKWTGPLLLATPPHLHRLMLTGIAGRRVHISLADKAP